MPDKVFTLRRSDGGATLRGGYLTRLSVAGVVNPPGVITTDGPFRLYRDSNLQSEISQLTGDNVETLARIERPVRLRTNLFPNGSFETDDVSVINPVANVSFTQHDDWSSGGRHSLLAIPTSGTQIIRVEPDPDRVSMAARPDRLYSCGVTVFNGSTNAEAYTLTFTVGGQSNSQTVTIGPGEFERLEVLALSSSLPHLSEIEDVGSVLFIPITFSLTSGLSHTTSQPVYVDDIYVGEGVNSDYVRTVLYPGGGIESGVPIKFWAKNISGVTMLNVRAYLAPYGPLGARAWADISPDPDIMSWSSAYNRSVPIITSLSPDTSAPFWVRVNIDERVDSRYIHRFSLRVAGDY